MGKLFSEYSIPIDSVYSSQWCRCKETARLAFGNFESLSALNSTFSADYQKNHSKQMSELYQFIKNWDDSQGNLIFVTHYVIVGGFLDYYPSSGEMVITDKSLSVLGTIKINFQKNTLSINQYKPIIEIIIEIGICKNALYQL